jgi:predicted transcriptional regulator
VKLDSKTEERIQKLAEQRHQTPDAIIHEAIHQYLDREERPGEKLYPRRSPVGGIITPA